MVAVLKVAPRRSKQHYCCIVSQATLTGLPLCLLIRRPPRDADQGSQPCQSHNFSNMSPARLLLFPHSIIALVPVFPSFRRATSLGHTKHKTCKHARTTTNLPSRKVRCSLPPKPYVILYEVFSGTHKSHNISYCFCSSVKSATIALASDRAWSVTACRGTPADAAKTCCGRVRAMQRRNCCVVI